MAKNTVRDRIHLAVWDLVAAIHQGELSTIVEEPVYAFNPDGCVPAFTRRQVADRSGESMRTVSDTLGTLVDEGVLDRRSRETPDRPATELGQPMYSFEQDRQFTAWFVPTVLPSDPAVRETWPSPKISGFEYESVAAFDGPQTSNMAANQGRGGGFPEREPRGNDAETGPAELQTIVEDVADEVLPGSGSKLEERRAALFAAVKYLTTNQTATPAELKEEVYPEHTGRYTSGKDPAQSWWKNCILPGLSAIAERADDVEAADYSGVWRYTPQVPTRG
jgi:hypothetical protein